MPDWRRSCWDCDGIGLVIGSVSRQVTDDTLRLLGWRFLEPGGRMVCPDCVWVRVHEVSQVAFALEVVLKSDEDVTF